MMLLRLCKLLLLIVIANNILLVAGCEESSVSKKEYVYNFGQVEAGKVYSCTFSVQNGTSRSLRILGTKVSCGSCTTVTKAPQRIQAHSNGDVVVTLNTDGKQGKLEQYVLIRTDDPVHPNITLRLRAVVSGVWLEPSVLDLGDLAWGEQYSQETYVLFAGLENLKITEVLVPPNLQNNITVSLGPADVNSRLSGQGISCSEYIRVSWNPRAGMQLPGPFRSRLQLVTSATGYKKIELELYGNV